MKILGKKIRLFSARDKKIAKAKKSGRENLADESVLDEVESVKSGLEAYKEKLQNPINSSPLLRRNIHRLEKALCFPVSKPIFAEDYVVETVQVLARLISSESFDGDEVVWAFDVLDKYFEVVDSSASPRIKDAMQQFNNLLGVQDFRQKERFPRSFGSASLVEKIDGQKFYDLCKARVSCRWFEDAFVDQRHVELAILSAGRAPSACNRQPFRFLWIRNKDLLKKVINLPFGTKGFGDELQNLIMVVGDLSCFALPRDRHLIYIDSCLAASQLMLSFTAQGLASVPINWPDVPENHSAARQLLGLERYEIPIMLIGFGYPKQEAMIPYSQKKSTDQLMVIYD
jgi:nitroreductase